MIIADAHQYLLDHYGEYDFIWSSPPCPSHSKFRRYFSVDKGGANAIYPDMKLYEEILFLKHYFKGKYCVENVVSYYDPLIQPAKINNHYFWINFPISHIFIKGRRIKKEEVFTNPNLLIDRLTVIYGFDLSKYKLSTQKKRTILRNCVEPGVGLHILNAALNIKSTHLPQQFLF